MKNILSFKKFNESVNENLNTQKMWGYYNYAFKNKYYKTIDDAKNDVRGRVEHQNSQSWASLFGKDDAEEIVNLFNYIQTKRGIKGVKIVPKIKQPIIKKEIIYNIDKNLINKQKNLWSDIRGIEFGRYLSNMEYINTNDKRIYGTEDTDDDNIYDIMQKLKWR